MSEQHFKLWHATELPKDTPVYIAAEVDAQITQLKEQVAEANTKCLEFETAYRLLFSKRAGRVADLQKSVWTALDRKSCPSVYMQIASEAILKNGCAELADAKGALERVQAEAAELQAQLAQKPASAVPEDREAKVALLTKMRDEYLDLADLINVPKTEAEEHLINEWCARADAIQCIALGYDTQAAMASPTAQAEKEQG